MKKILITGSTGFIGSNILKELVKKNIVYLTIRNRKSFLKNKKIKIINFKNHKELNNKLQKIKVETVIHCATHYVKFHKFEDISKITNTNIEFGNILLENLESMNVKKFVNFSTVWENFNGQKNVPYNLYSASKNAFGSILNFYQKKHNNIKFYNIFISDTYGKNDKRKKLISFLQKNYLKKKTIKIVSKNLYINLLNVKDIVLAINIILNKKIKPGNYTLSNNVNFKISKIFNSLLKKKNTKLRIKWLSSKTLKEKIYKFGKLPYWKPKFSSFVQFIDFILRLS